MSWLSVNWLIAATDEPVVRLTPQARIVAAILAGAPGVWLDAIPRAHLSRLRPLVLALVAALGIGYLAGRRESPAPWTCAFASPRARKTPTRSVVSMSGWWRAT